MSGFENNPTSEKAIFEPGGGGRYKKPDISDIEILFITTIST